jgi:hypothetical protein
MGRLVCGSALGPAAKHHSAHGCSAGVQTFLLAITSASPEFMFAMKFLNFIWKQVSFNSELFGSQIRLPVSILHGGVANSKGSEGRKMNLPEVQDVEETTRVWFVKWGDKGCEALQETVDAAEHKNRDMRNQRCVNFMRSLCFQILRISARNRYHASTRVDHCCRDYICQPFFCGSTMKLS